MIKLVTVLLLIHLTSIHSNSDESLDQAPRGCELSAVDIKIPPQISIDDSSNPTCFFDLSEVPTKVKASKEVLDSGGCYLDYATLPGVKSTANPLHLQFNVTGVDLHCYNKSYHLIINWHYSISSAASVLVATTSSLGSDSCIKYKLDYLHVGLQQTGGLLDKCVFSIDTSQEYNIEIYEGRDRLAQYRLLTPDRLLINTESVSDSDWKTIVLVTLDSIHITVLVQPIPSNTKYRYLLNIVHTRGNVIQLESADAYWIKQGSTQIIGSSHGVGTYKLEFLLCDPSLPKDDISTCTIQQEVTFTATTSQISHMDTNNGPASTSRDVISEVIKEDNSGILQDDLIILLATVFGVLLVVAIIGVILFVYFRRRNSSNNGVVLPRFTGNLDYADGLILDEDEKSQAPVVLLIYSYDFQLHLSCVQSLAVLLQNELGCVVLADFWATQEIADRGLRDWLLSNLPRLDYIIIVCSTGVRFKSAVHRRTYHQVHQDDSFLAALSLLQARAASLLCQKLVVYFDYSNDSDIPPLLENWQRLNLPSDLQSLTSILQESQAKDGVTRSKSKCKHSYSKQLVERVAEAKQFMVDNPNWFNSILGSHALPTDKEEEVKEQRGSKDELNQSRSTSQPLEVVTVEHHQYTQTTGARTTKSNSKHSLDNLGSYHVVDTVEPPHLNYSQAQKVKYPTKTAQVISASDSYSSSTDDIEHDIQFILNPTLANSNIRISSKYMTAPHALIDLLPDIQNSDYRLDEFHVPGPDSMSLSSSNSGEY